LNAFESLLLPKGLLLFTVPGHYLTSLLRQRKLQWQLSDEMTEKLLAGFDEHGFGYEDFPGYEQGITLAKPSWVCAELEKHPGLRLLGLHEAGFTQQDVYSCMKKAD
jgi:hypothetical protein